MNEEPRSAESSSGGQIDTPVWIRMADAIKLTSLSRSTLYELIQQRKIRSKSLKRRPDAHHGVRLISYDSLLEYIDSQGDDGVAKSRRLTGSDDNYTSGRDVNCSEQGYGTKAQLPNGKDSTNLYRRLTAAQERA